MADNIVDSLFGPQPWQVQQQQNEAMRAEAERIARMDGFQQAKYGIGRGAGMLAGAGMEAAGYVNPAVAQAQMNEQNMAGLDPSDPKSLLLRASQIQDPRLKWKLMLAARKQAQEDQASSLKMAQEAAAWKRAEQEASPLAKIDPSKYTQESMKAYIASGMKDPSLLVAAEKPQYESMGPEEKLTDAIVATKAKIASLPAGSPERAAQEEKLKTLEKMTDKKTHISIPQINSQYNLDDKQQAALDLAMQEGRLNPDRVNSRSAKILANQFILNPKLDMVAGVGDAKTRTSAQVKVGTQLSVLRPFVKMVDMNGEVLKTLAEKAIVTNVALANRPINWIEQNIGDYPDMAEFLAQTKIFKDEAARVVSNPNLVGVLSDTARKEMEAVISGNMPLKSMKRVIERLQADSHNRISTMEAEYAGIRGGSTRAEGAAMPAIPAAAPSLANQIPGGAAGVKPTVSNW